MFFPLSKPPTSKEISELLRAVAAAYVVTGAGRFRIAAYQKAADSVEHASRDIYEIWQDKGLQKLPGIGGSIGDHLSKLFESGDTEYFEKAFEGLPPGMFGLLPVPGIGPKNAHKIALHLGLTDYSSAIDDLEKAAQAGKIQEMDGFKEDSEKKILAGIEEYRGRGDRMLLSEADVIMDTLLTYLSELAEVKRVEPLGSLRRKANTVGDLDLAVATDDGEKVIAHFCDYPDAKRVVEAGNLSATILLHNGTHVDLMVIPEEHFGSMIQHFTGSKAHNIVLRELALKQGLSLSEKGITVVKTKKVVRFESEELFYKRLGLAWVPPELRENNGEIALAAKGDLPNLIERKDLKGEFHLHSNFDVEPSHDLGESSMEEMLEVAGKMGYEYLAFSEHNPSMSGHSVKEVVEIVKRKRALVNELNSHEKSVKHFVKAFNSMEIDIRPDGSLALPDEAWEYLDFAVVSVHSSFNQPEKDVMRRLFAAMEHPKAKILGHPTGRLINERSGIDIDWEALFDFCVKHGKWLDIDGWPSRRDLPEDRIREAVKHGVKMVISSDAHRAADLEMIKYGVYTARRGWASKENIINTLSLADFEKLLK